MAMKMTPWKLYRYVHAYCDAVKDHVLRVPCCDSLKWQNEHTRHCEAAEQHCDDDTRQCSFLVCFSSWRPSTFINKLKIQPPGDCGTNYKLRSSRDQENRRSENKLAEKQFLGWVIKFLVSFLL